MNKIFLPLLLILFFSSSLSGQARKERIKAFRIAIFVEELQLTEKESADFFPIYNAFEQEQEDLKEQHRKVRRNIELASDEEARAQIEKMLQLEEEQIDLKRKYFNRFMEVLPIRKVLRIPKAEQEFRRLLLEKIRENREDD